MTASGYKLPQVTALFWVLKIAATTLGETGGDLIAQTLGLGYAAASVLFVVSSPLDEQENATLMSAAIIIDGMLWFMRVSSRCGALTEHAIT